MNTPLRRGLLLLVLILAGSSRASAAQPVAGDDFLMVLADTSITADFRLNDSDADNDPLSITSTTSPPNGSLVDNGDGSFTYTPTVGFAGIDSFTYDLTDGGTTVSATVTVSVNAGFDPELARDQILLGVGALVNPVQPGHIVVYGPTAYSISNYPGNDLSDPMIAASTIGQGRVLALPDHQWLNLGSYGSDPSMGTFYKNGIAWLADSVDLNISIVTYNSAANASWLISQGFTNVVNASSASLAANLAGAEVFVAGWLGSSVSSAVLQTAGDFVTSGGGLFIADYGIGYDWWWGLATENIPGNRLLRAAGIGFTKNGPHGSSAQSINRGVGQVTFADVLALVTDWSTATLAQKSQGAAILVKLDSVLADDDLLQAELNARAMASAGTLFPSPTTPVSDSFEKALLVWESNNLLSLPVTETVAHPTAFGVGTNAPRVNVTRTLHAPNGHATIRIPTGLYAAPGEIVTVQVPAGFQGLGLRVRISHLRTDLGDSNYYHMPFQQVYFDLNAPSVAIASPFGGLISIEAAAGEDGITNVVFGFNNVVEAPYYVHGVTTDLEWVGGIRDRETPFGVLVTDKTIHVIESEAHLRSLSDPEQVMQIWEDMILRIEEFYSYTTYRPLRIHHDYQPAGGVSTFPQSYGVTSVMLDYTSLVNFGYPLTHHEYGHIVDPSQMHIQNFSEAAPNFGGIYASRFFLPFTYRPKGAKERIRRYENSQSLSLWPAAPHSYHHEKITPFICLADAFGWDPLIDVIAALKQTSPSSNQDRLDNWLTIYSNEIGHDLSPFFALWQLSPSPTALSAVSGLPAWNMVEMVEEQLVLHRDTAVTLPSPDLNDFSYDGTLALVNVTQASNGTIVILGSGDLQYTPNLDFTGSDSFDYTVVNGTGNNFTATVPITVLDPANSPKLYVGVAIAETSAWTPISLPNTYVSPVVVAEHVRSGGMPRLVTRIRNVGSTSFELRLQRPDGSSAPVTGVTVNYIVAEEGAFSAATHGIQMEAVKRLSTVTDRTGNLVGEEFEPAWNTLDHYAQPVFFGQVMSFNDPDWSVWWSNPASQTIVAGKHVGSDFDTTRADEMLGYLAMESGTLQFQQTYMRFGDTSSELLETFGSSGNSVSFPDEPQITAALVQGTGLNGTENAYWSAVDDTNDYAGNVVGMTLQNDAGLSTPTDRASYLVAARISQDCNSNSIPDEFEIAAGTSGDCNANGVLDSCDLAAGTSEDCNSNDIPDSCEIASGAVEDANGNSIPDSCELEPFRRGDANVDGAIDIGDPIAMLGFLFSGTPVPCALSLDSNDDNGVDVADPIHLLGYLFSGGSGTPPAPFLVCGPDLTPGGTLSCADFSLCP